MEDEKKYKTIIVNEEGDGVYTMPHEYILRPRTPEELDPATEEFL